MNSSRKLSGHKGPVSCLKICPESHILVSGAEDNAIRVWDLRSMRTSKCMTGCLSSDIEAITYVADKHMLYVACTKGLYSFDLHSGGLIVKEANSEVSLNEGGDEVASIAINVKGDMLAVAMDSGVINLLPIKANGSFCENSGATRYKKLSRVHTNIVSTVAFKKNNPRELISGGFDYAACIWETDRGRPKASTSFKALPSEDAGTEGQGGDGGGVPLQMVNPPFVMALQYVLGGRCVVAALGDGTVRILNAKDLSHLTAIEAHNCMITALWTDDCHIITGGADCKINVYKLSLKTDSSNSTSQNGAKPKSGGSKKKAPTPLGTPEVEVVQLFTIEHDAKINALACTFGEDNTVSTATSATAVKASTEATETTLEAAPTTLSEEGNSNTARSCTCYVADTTHDITVYTYTYTSC